MDSDKSQAMNSSEASDRREHQDKFKDSKFRHFSAIISIASSVTWEHKKERKCTLSLILNARVRNVIRFLMKSVCLINDTNEYIHIVQGHLTGTEVLIQH